MSTTKNIYSNIVYYNYDKLLLDYYKIYKCVDYAFVFRFLYLCTLSDVNGLIMNKSLGINDCSNNKNTIRDIAKELNISLGCTHKTINVARALNLIIKKEDGYYININKIEIVNSLDCNKQKSIHVSNSMISILYKNSKPMDHKIIGMSFKFIGHTHIKNGILCSNPYEENDDKIKPLCLKEICDIVDFDYSNAKNLIQHLSSVKINDKGIIIPIIMDDVKIYMIHNLYFDCCNQIIIDQPLKFCRYFNTNKTHEYLIYKIDFQQYGIYIGQTKDLQNRLMAHISNARTQKHCDVLNNLYLMNEEYFMQCIDNTQIVKIFPNEKNRIKVTEYEYWLQMQALLNDQILLGKQYDDVKFKEYLSQNVDTNTYYQLLNKVFIFNHPNINNA